MRWSYIISRITVLFLVWALFFFGMDPALRWSLRRAGEAAAGAKVEIAGLKTRIFPPSLVITGMQVADRSDPFKNLFQFDSLAFKMEGKPLLEKKFVVKDASLLGLKLGTKRDISGALHRQLESKSFAAFEKLKQKTKEFSIAKTGEAKTQAYEQVDITASSLETTRLAEKIKADFAAQSAAWKEKTDSAKFNERLEAIKAGLEKLKSQQDVVSRVAAANSMREDITKLKSEIETSKNLLDSTLKQAGGSLSSLEEARRKDLEGLLAKLKIPSLDTRSLTGFLLGPETAGRVGTALHWLEVSRSRMSNAPAAKAKVREKAGTVIHFHKEHVYPSFLLKNMAITGEMPSGDGQPPLRLEGTAEGFTSQPAVYGKPAVLRLNGSGSGRKMSLLAELDHTGEIPRDRLGMSMEGFPLRNMEAGSDSSLLIRTSGGKGSVSSLLEMRGENLDGKISLKAEGIRLEAKAAEPNINALLSKALTGDRNVQASISVSGTLDDPSMSASSDLGEILANALKSAAGKELEERKKEIEAKLDAAVKPVKDGLAAQMKEKEKELLDKANLNSSKISELQNKLLNKLKLDKKSIIPEGLKIPGLKW